VTRRGSFDADGFYAALDLERQSRRLTWKEVASEAGISASTLSRMKQGKRPDVDSLAALASWSGLDVDNFVVSDERSEAAALPKIAALLRSDPHLTRESAIAIEEVLRMTYERLREDARR
jgi:transcriptional regulator with XRE-family HTH domain